MSGCSLGQDNRRISESRVATEIALRARLAKAAGARYFSVINLHVLPRFSSLRYIAAYIPMLYPRGPGSPDFQP